MTLEGQTTMEIDRKGRNTLETHWESLIICWNKKDEKKKMRKNLKRIELLSGLHKCVRPGDLVALTV